MNIKGVMPPAKTKSRSHDLDSVRQNEVWGTEYKKAPARWPREVDTGMAFSRDRHGAFGRLKEWLRVGQQ